MPGILPMKVIKVGGSNQSRIAQACDRCRSKKIRCDGIRPCCTQCANVGFECKTSDKLSRRAFPRGYTESLEERVRALEAEVRELKDLLDEKDEKIDLLSRIHSFSPTSRKSSSVLSPNACDEVKSSLQENNDDTFHVEPPSISEEDEKAALNTFGGSSTQAFVGSFKAKVRQTDKHCAEFTCASFFSPKNQPSSPRSPPDSTSSVPPRIVTDQLINIYFQEWAPLFPVLHRPTVLKLYEDFCANPDSLQNDKHAIAQLFLVFSIAATSSISRTRQDTLPLERQWQKCLGFISSKVSIPTLQCLVLAQIYALAMADYGNLSRYKGLAVALSHQLGLHHSQAKYSHGALTRETRKRVFWCQYVVDRFSSAASGMPMMIREEDVHTEYPADVDDENVTEKGFLPTLPGESTRLSSALALFSLSRLLTKVLEHNYPSAISYDLSLSRVHGLAEDLDLWLKDLAPHLRLQFVQDKPSTNVISSRSPILSLGYYYIRSLIHRPVVLSSSSSSSASALALADSSKHIVQIIELLDERTMSFSFCLNRNELLLASGFGLLYQCLDLKHDSKLIKDSQRLIRSVVDLLQAGSATGAATFKKVAISLVSEGTPKGSLSLMKSIEPASTKSNNSNSDSMSPPDSTARSARKQLQAIASRFSFSPKPVKPEDVPRRATMSRVPSGHLAMYSRNHSQLSVSSARSEPVPRRSPQKSASIELPMENLNLDYFPLGTDPVPSYPKMNKPTMTPSDWERILSTMDNGNANIYDGIYGGPSPGDFSSYAELYPTTSNGQDWAPEVWPVSATELQPKAPVPQSVLSFSDESLTSGEDLSSSGCQEYGQDSFKGIMMPQLTDDFELEGLPGSWEF